MPRLKSSTHPQEYFNVSVPVKISSISLAMLDDVIQYRFALDGKPLYRGRSSLIRVALIKFLNEEIKKINKKK